MTPTTGSSPCPALRLPTRTFLYDGEGVLRKTIEGAAVRLRYVTGEYQVTGSGEPSVYYRFGGRAVAWHNDSVLRYLLADHLGSTHGEASESGGETGQRRYRPWGSDRDISLGSLTRDERYTGQRRVETGDGTANRGLDYFGVRWYRPGD